MILVEPVPAPDPVAVLSDWDRRRAAAWASGDPDALRPLYVPGSAAGRADRRMLAAYAERGLRVSGLQMQVLAVAVEAAGPRRLVLGVTDRLAAGTAVGEGVLVDLPGDEVSTRTVVLRVVDGAWRVVEVWDQRRAASPVAITDSTSGSRNE